MRTCIQRIERIHQGKTCLDLQDGKAAIQQVGYVRSLIIQRQSHPRFVRQHELCFPRYWLKNAPYEPFER